MAKNIIKLNRGDSYEFKVRIPSREDSTKDYRLTDSDVIYFAILYPQQRFEEAFLIKGYDHTDYVVENGTNTGDILIKIEPKDTKSLTPGIYYYTIKLQRGGTIGIVGDCDNAEEIRTIVERTKFIIYD